ncbi:peptidase inhibitor family I36 protein [Streptomyces uncialis]|uniref:peptidase inhibitor family I36 protein n=1 Tax=Streptomyces uncialis TaxID=1048205 RepID=UPI003656D94F
MAPASARLSQCPDINLCAWSDENFNGIFKRYPDSAPHLGGDNDRFDSLGNRDAYSWLVFEHANEGCARRCLRPGCTVSKLADVSGNWHDRISSLKKHTRATCPAGYEAMGSHYGS